MLNCLVAVAATQRRQVCHLHRRQRIAGADLRLHLAAGDTLADLQVAGPNPNGGLALNGGTILWMAPRQCADWERRHRYPSRHRHHGADGNASSDGHDRQRPDRYRYRAYRHHHARHQRTSHRYRHADAYPHVPATPTVAPTNDTGISSADHITSDPALTFSGLTAAIRCFTR